MRCRASRGNDLRSNRRVSPSAIWQKKSHIRAHPCVRIRTATTAKCLESLRLEHSDHRRPHEDCGSRARVEWSGEPVAIMSWQWVAGFSKVSCDFKMQLSDGEPVLGM